MGCQGCARDERHPRLIFIGCLSWAAWQCGASECLEQEDAESALLQIQGHSASHEAEAFAMPNYSLEAVLNSTLEDVNRMQNIFWTGKLGRSSSRILETSGIQATGTGTKEAGQSAWLHKAAGLLGQVGEIVLVILSCLVP